MLIRILSFALVILFFSNCKSINQRKDSATAQINNLKSGVLLVRLPSNAGKIEKLKSMGQGKLAKKEKVLMKQFHTQVLRSFDQSFDFCPVYFYHSENSKQVKSRKFEGNIFDDNKNEIGDLEFAPENIFYAEFGQVHSEEMTVNKNGETTKVAGFGGKDALVIRNQDGLQPPRPFPYAMDYKSIINDNNLGKSVEKLNKRLHDAYDKMQRRYLRRKARGKVD